MWAFRVRTRPVAAGGDRLSGDGAVGGLGRAEVCPAEAGRPALHAALGRPIAGARPEVIARAALTAKGESDSIRALRLADETDVSPRLSSER